MRLCVGEGGVGEGDRGEERSHGGDRLAVGVVAARRACGVWSIVMVIPWRLGGTGSDE